MIRILIVDDQTLFTESLKTYIHNYADDIQVAGVATNGKEALLQCKVLQPDLILMDVHMPEMNGVEATKRILQKYPALKIIMLSTYDEDDYVREALQYGAAGYLLKDLSPTELIASIRAVSGGVSQISPSLLKNLMQSFHQEETTMAEHLGEQEQWISKLTKREKEIFFLIATGCDNEQIAQELYISEGTVRNHVSTIYAKLEIDNRFQIIQLANKIRYHK